MFEERVAVHLVTWNGEKYIPYLFESLKKQTYRNWKLYILDNGSSDKTVEKIIEAIKDFPVPVSTEFVSSNTGFAGGHNILYQKNSCPLILLLNQDMYLSPTCFQGLADFMESNAEVASISPRLMRWDFSAIEKKMDLSVSFSDEIDSLGLKIFRNRQITEQYTKEKWALVEKKNPGCSFSVKNSSSGIKESVRAFPVFGVSGTLPLYRRTCLEKITPNGQVGFFDSSFHAYKEDVDVAFRLRILGFKSFVLLDSFAYHDRSAAGVLKPDLRSIIRNKQKQSEWVRYHSYKNHLAVLYKNEYWQNALLDFPFIFWYEIKKFVYYLCAHPKVLRGLFEFFLNRKNYANARKFIFAHKKSDWRRMRVWWK